MTYIKTLTAPLIIIAGLALLTACGGGATPLENTNEDPVVNCTEAPFDSPDMCEDQKITACQMHGTNVDAGGHASCDDRINMACTEDPFVYNGCDTLDDAIRNNFCALPDNRFNAGCITNNLGGDGRMTFCEMPDNRFNADCIANNLGGDGRTTFCEMPDNIFTLAECMDLGNINDIRMTFCEMPDNRFNADCITNNLGGGGRTTFCNMPDNRFNADCIANNLGGGGRTTFCDMPTNRFNADCIANNLGGGGRTTFCEMPANIFTHEDCKKISNINNIRMTFCEMPANRFNQGCIDGGLGGGGRTTFCNMPENLFNQDCLDNNLGNDDNRDTACLTSPKGDPVDESCRADRPEVITACQMNPFSTTNTGCENLDTIVSIRDIHCGTSPNSAIDRCTVDYADWEASFGAGKAPMTTPTTATRRNEFLNAGDGTLSSELEMAFGSELMAESITILNLSALEGGDATDGVAYFIFEDSGQQYHYAGLLSSTDLGAPSFQETGTAIWKGEFNATKLDQKSDFDLEVTFGGGSGDVAGSIEAFVASGDEHFLLKGDYDAKGVISGTVNYGTFTTGTRTPTGSRVDNGILTGLIGRQGAVGAFLSGTGDKDDITGGTSAMDGFAGGFVANPFDGNVSYSDWANSGPRPAATANTASPVNELLQTTRNDLNIGTITGTAVHVNLATATYEDVALGGLATNGFTAFIGTANNYAGITSTTNLGVALVQTIGMGAWKGSFVVYEGGATTTTDFELMIDFAATSKVSATIGDYSFTDISVNSNGTFGGGITLNRLNVPNGSGTMSGIIGQDGAVGVFVSDSTADVSYAGGFVATPEPCVLADNCVNHAAWLASFGASPPPATRAAANPGTNTFGGFLNLADGVRDISNAGLTSPNADTHLTLDGDGENGMHGVVYRAGRNGTNQQAFVAVLPTTNLGAPLTQASGTATWLGTYYNSSLVRDENNIPFLIDFGAKTITASRLVSLGPSNITTTFALNFTPATGVITGTVSEGSTPATARGLIGEKGLVGVYVDTRTGRPGGSGVVYGGFVADNPNN